MSNAIPNDIRPPLCYIGFDNSKAIIGTAAMPHQILVIGQMLPTGRAEACTLYPFNDGDEAAALWGRGSLMHGLASQVKGANRFTQVLGVALPEAFNLVDKDYQAAVKTAAVESEGSLMVGFKTPTLEFDVDESEAAEQGWRVSVGNKTAALKSFSTQTGFMVIAAGEGLAAADLAVDVSMTLHGVEATAAGVAARGVQRFIGTALEDAIIYLHIAGKSLSILAQKGDTAAEMAQNITNAVNGDDDFPVRAESADGAVTYTAKQTGETGNDIRVVCNYYAGQAFPSGVMTTNISLSGGQGNPDVSDAISAMADEWFNHIIMPYRDTANLNALRDEMTERWGPMKMTEGTAYLAFSGTHAQTATFGESRNDFLYSCMGAGSSPTPAYLWAASYGAVAAYELAIDPARPLQTLVLPGVLPPPVSERWDLNERNLLLHDGIATHKVDAGGNVMIEREVTMYRLNSYG
ncbi:phage tail sheath subtilisin-like domain-containing protein, partial [Vibrio scophthalmi]